MTIAKIKPFSCKTLLIIVSTLALHVASRASTFEWTVPSNQPGGPDYTWYLPVLVEQTTLQDALRVRDQNGNIAMTQNTIVYVWNPISQQLNGANWDDLDNAWSSNWTLYPGGAIYIQIDQITNSNTITIHLNGTPISGQIAHTLKPGGNMFAIPPSINGFRCASELGLSPVQGDIVYFYSAFPTPTQTGSTSSTYDDIDLAWLPDNCGENGSVIYIYSNAQTNRQWTVSY